MPFSPLQFSPFSSLNFFLSNPRGVSRLVDAITSTVDKIRTPTQQRYTSLATEDDDAFDEDADNRVNGLNLQMMLKV